MRTLRLGLLLTALASVSASQAAVTTLHVFNFDFGDANLNHVDPTINIGDTVHWIWDDNGGVPHSTISSAGQLESWNSSIFTSPGHVFDHVFTHAGNFSYYCAVHGFDNGNGTAGGMSGIIHVRTVPEPASLLALGVGAAFLLRRRKKG